MLPLFLLAASALAQTPDPIRFPSGQVELAYLHQAGEGAVLLVLPAQPETAAEEWKTWAPIGASRKWHVAMPQFAHVADPGVKNLEAMVADLRKRFPLERSPVYLVGGGLASPSVFYAASRAPYLFTAALAIGGSPKPAIDSDRIYGANTVNTPVAWALSSDERTESAALRQRLTTAGFNLTVLEAPTVGSALDFLAKQLYTPVPRKIDCETGNPTMARCYWVRMTAFDPSLRNDALPSSRVNADSPASLEFGPFGYQPSKPGPGILIEWLPQGYKGPLQLNDRIIALSGKPVSDPRHYAELMSQVTDERPVSVTIERVVPKQKEPERMRLTTRYQLRKREEVTTARLQGEYLQDSNEILIVTRNVAGIELAIPQEWAGAKVNWNGNLAASPQNPGCYVLSLKEPGAARPCSQ